MLVQGNHNFNVHLCDDFYCFFNLPIRKSDIKSIPIVRKADAMLCPVHLPNQETNANKAIKVKCANV